MTPFSGDPTPGRAGPLAGAALAAAALMAACGGSGAVDRADETTWAVPGEEACQGLTVGWPVPFDRLGDLVGPGLVPVDGPEPGTGVLLLFAAECTGSTVGGEPTGSFATAHLLVPVEPPSLPEDLLPGEPPPRWVAVPRTFGPVDGPVRTLFAEGGFRTREARVTFDLRPTDGGGFEAGFSIHTQDGGAVTVAATVADSVESFRGETGLVTRADDRWSIATGPESASRYEPGTARVRFEGTDLLAGLDPGSRPQVVSLDRHFRWTFTFRRENAP